MTTGFASKGVGEAQRRFAMSNAPLMPKATAVWLLDNTALTFDQVADFTKMHIRWRSGRSRTVTPRRASRAWIPFPTAS